jgi:hypothetical protein
MQLQHGSVEALSHPTVMAARTDPIQINCKFETYELIHRSVVAAARRARQDGDDKLRLALSNVLLTLGEAQGLSTHHLSDLNLWDVD